MNALVFSFTQKVSERAYSTSSKKSMRMKISPPLKTRKNTPAAANWSSTLLISAVVISPWSSWSKIAMDAALVAAVGEVHLDAQRNAKREGPVAQLLHQAHVVLAQSRVLRPRSTRVES